MRWNHSKATDLLSSVRAGLSDVAPRTPHQGIRQEPPRTEWRPARGPRSRVSDEDRRADEWLVNVSQSVPGSRLAPPGDFTARVMARLEPGSLGTPLPVGREEPTPSVLERLCIVGGVLGISFLLVAATMVLTMLLASNMVFALLNMLVAVLVSVAMVAKLLFDALNALAANPPLVCLLLALLAGMLALWSSVLHPAARTAGEA